ncbi:MAG TPA: hypothetical protein VNJ01_06150 [Bacteriovoracaceae bacterium]|nr:hypothetical protein [Bacteriovoracaceae bacterium]
MKFLTLSMFALTLTTGAWAQSGNQVRDRAAIDQLFSTTKGLSASDLSCSKTTDCTAMELGSKACGGPSDFVVASKKNKNLEEVSYLAQRTVDRENDYNVSYNVISDCMLRLPPEVSCQANVCKGE